MVFSTSDETREKKMKRAIATRIDFDTKIPNKRQAAFVIMYTRSWQPYLEYPEVSEADRDVKVPTCLMLLRWDGCMGFPGGFVDENESLEEAVVREVREELGVRMFGKRPSSHEVASAREILEYFGTTVFSNQLEPLVAHELDRITTHAFLFEASPQELLLCQRAALQAKDHGSEGVGAVLPHLIDYSAKVGPGRGLKNFLSGSFASSVLEELTVFLLERNLVSREVLAACLPNDTSLEELEC